MRRRPPGISLLLGPPTMVLMGLLLLHGCAEAPETRKRPNVILVVVDTLRSDVVGSYGGPPAATPFLDELAEASVRFEDVTSASSHTVPSVISILSGVYPHHHGNQYFPETVSLRVPQRRARPSIPESVPSLATNFRKAGYLTAAVVSNPWLRGDFGFSRGFSEYRYLHGRDWVDHPKGERVNEVAISLIENELGDGPFFLYLHYMDAHPPFDPSGTHGATFTRGLPGRVLPVRNGPAPDVSDEDVAYTRALYTAGVRDLDDALRALVTQLRDRGLAERTLLVIASDHGEEFHEHGGMGHGFQLFEEVTRVPLLFAYPALTPRTISFPVSGVDLSPTLLDLVGLPVPEQLDGISLAPWVLGSPASRPPADRVLLSELGTLVAARRGHQKLIRPPEPEARGTAYDLAAGEGRETAPAVAEAGWPVELKSEVDRILAQGQGMGAGQQPPVAEEPEFERRLRAIGYVE